MALFERDRSNVGICAAKVVGGIWSVIGRVSDEQRQWRFARGCKSAADLPDTSNGPLSPASSPAPSSLLCMGLFSIFWLGARTRSIGRN
jgi:hypothetical protein